jgi:hypothetical protein
MPIFRFEIHHFHHYPEIAAVSEQLANVTAEVAALRGVVTSGATLLARLADQIEALQNDPAALQALADDLRAQRTELANAIAENDGDPTTNPEDQGST